MPKILVVYYSRGGNTKKMAELAAKGAKAEGVEVELKKVQDTEAKELLSCDGVIAGSPTYYGSMASELKDLIDRSVTFHGQMEGKVGAAFSSAANVGGGNETTVLDILHAFLIHGMVVQGNSDGDHYGPVAIEAPDERSKPQCEELGRRTARLVKKLHG